MREMKDSGIAWIGEIPKEWEVGPVGMFFNEINNPNSNQEETNTLQFKMGDIISKKNGDSKYNPETIAAYNVVEPGTIMINGLNLSFDLISQRVAQVHERGAITSTYLAMMPKNGLQSDYAKYMLKAYDNCKALHSMGRGLRATLSYSTFRTEPIFKPSIEEQRLIANFLDEKCGEIDELVALQEKMIDELKAYKQSVITETVTKGLDPNVKMKDCGVNWIGEIPEDWTVCKLKTIICSLESGCSVNAENIAATGEEYGVLKTSCVSKNYFVLSENKKVEKNEYHRVKCPVKADTIIVSRMNTPELVGAAAYCDEDVKNIFLPDRIWQVSFCKKDIFVKYVWYYLISTNTKQYYSSLSAGTSSSMQNISQSQFENAFVTYPQIDIQKSIVVYLDTKCSEIDSLISIKQKKIEELKDYKKSLIYEYVTGKKQVG